jgi:DNA-directed RNA polymerase specialized sigma24 family protein
VLNYVTGLLKDRYLAEDVVQETMLRASRHCGEYRRRALERLSPSHRAVIEEIYLNGCTAREAAARLGIPEGTAFSRSYYALGAGRRGRGVAFAGAGASGGVTGGVFEY